MDKPSELSCKNCDEITKGNFCNNCGQKTSVDRITFKETFNDFTDTIFSVNAPLFITFKLLVTNPGRLFREYLSGSRKKYYKPVAFFILSTIIYLVLRSLISYDAMDGMVAVSADEVDEKLFADASKYMTLHINNFLFLFVFTMGIFLKLFFNKKNSLIEFIAISFYAVSVYILFVALISFYLKYVNASYKMLPMVLFMIYMVSAFLSYFKTKNILTILKLILTYYLSLIFYVALSYSLSLLIVWLI